MTRIPMAAPLAILVAFAAQPAGAGERFGGRIAGFRPAAVRVISGGIVRAVFRGHRERLHAGLGWGLPYGGVGGYFGSPDRPADWIGDGAPPAPDGAAALYQIMALGRPDKARICESQAQWVPGPNGQVEIDVTRC